MVDTVDHGEEEHSGVNPISSTGDGETMVSREEFNVALDTLKTSMTTPVFLTVNCGVKPPQHIKTLLI